MSEIDDQIEASMGIDDDDAPDGPPPDLDAPRRKVIDPRTLPARFHHLRAAGQSGAHCLHAFQGESDDSLAKRLGSGTHALMFDKPFAVWDIPAKNGKGTAKRDPRSEAWKAFQRAHAGKPILSTKEHTLAQRIRDAVRGHRIAERLLFGPGMVHEHAVGHLGAFYPIATILKLVSESLSGISALALPAASSGTRAFHSRSVSKSSRADDRPPPPPAAIAFLPK